MYNCVDASALQESEDVTSPVARGFCDLLQLSGGWGKTCSTFGELCK